MDDIPSPSRRDLAYFDAAKAVSTLSDHKQHKLGCVVVDSHRIISSGSNSVSRHHRVQVDLDNKFFGKGSSLGPIHAESAALIPLMSKGVNLKGATLYVYREHKNGIKALAHPCERCMQLIQKCGIKRIKYTIEDGYSFEKLFY